MKKGIKVTAATAIALSAITPVAAFAANADETVATGIYTNVGKGFYTASEFQKLSAALKKQIVADTKSAYVVGGVAYNMMNDVILKSNTQLNNVNTTVAEYQTTHDVTFYSGNGFKPAENVGDLKVESVSAINLRELVVTFNKPVDADVTAINPDNYFIKLTNETTGAVTTNSFKTLTSNDLVASVSTDGKTVTWSSKSGKLLNGGSGSLGLVLNEEYTVQVRNVKDADGKNTDVQQVSSKLVDKVAPKVSLKSTKLVDGKLNLIFDEPVATLKNGSAYRAGVGIVVDGDALAYTAVTTDTVVNGVVGVHKTATLDLSSLNLANGTHTISLAGIKDLNGNLLSPNPTTFTFTVEDAVVSSLVTPKVDKIDQIADNAFKIIFNTTNVKATALATGVVTIKNGAYNGTLYSDIVLDAADFVSNGAENFNKVEAVEIAANPAKGITAHTEWIVYTKGNANAAVGELSYRNANIITKDVVVDKYFNDGLSTGTPGTQDTGEPAGTKQTVSATFQKDITAPVYEEIKVDAATPKQLDVYFTDAPFTTDGNGKVDVVAGKSVVVKYVDTNNVTHTQAFTTSAATDTDKISLAITNPNMLNAAGTALIAGGKYTVTLSDGVVKDADETIFTANLFQLLDGAHPFVGKSVEYTVSGTSDVTVPQTTQGLILSNDEIQAGGPGTLAAAIKTGSIGSALKDNQIVVIFEGDVDGTTAGNAANYKVNGSTVAALGGNVEYRVGNIDGASGDEKYALITLPLDTVGVTASYSFEVANVANKTGNKMLAVSDTVQLTDNTVPFAQSVTIKDSNTIIVKFSEKVKLASGATAAQAYKNFSVTVNGKTLSVSDIADLGTNQLTLRLADNFTDSTLDVPATVKVQLDNNGDMFIVDTTGNKAKAGTVTK